MESITFPPCFTIGSWYDFMNQGSIASFVGRQNHGGDLADPRRAIRPAHFLEQWRGSRIVADVVKGLNLGMTLHIRLPSKDVDLQRFGLRRGIDGESSHCQGGKSRYIFEFIDHFLVKGNRSLPFLKLSNGRNN